MISKPIDQIKEEDLLNLISNKVTEKKKIEYKELLNVNTDNEKKEFLADVSSFANASGGDLIIGIIENRHTGEPIELAGINLVNPDQEILKLDSIIRDGIQPRIPSVEIQKISLSNSNFAFVIRIQQSWIAPHRVSFKGHHKFYSRSSNGKYQLDIEELRILFNLGETRSERIKKFREERISKIFACETPVPTRDNAKIVLHIIPFISFNPAQNYEISSIASDIHKLLPINCVGSCNGRYNIDGFLTYYFEGDEITNSYTQLFRNGIIEAVEGYLLDNKFEDGKLIIPSIAYEERLIQSLSIYLDVLKSLNVELPIFIFLSLINVKNYSMYVGRLYPPNDHTIDRDILLLPEIIIDNYETSADILLKPCFDSIWNACGYPKSLNYNNNGRWFKRM